MAYNALDNLRGNIIGCAAYGPLLLLSELEFCGQAEVANLEFHTTADKDVSHFEVAMDNTMSVHVLNCRKNLVHEILGFTIGEFLAALEHFTETLVSAQLEEDVNVIAVLKAVLELHDVRVVQRLVDLDFRQQLHRLSEYFLLGTVLIQR
jgi:hypothetical protein